MDIHDSMDWFKETSKPETMVFTIKFAIKSKGFQQIFPIIQFYEVINSLTMRTKIHQNSSDVFQMIADFGPPKT
jgi:hypothetical protein